MNKKRLLILKAHKIYIDIKSYIYTCMNALIPFFFISYSLIMKSYN